MGPQATYKQVRHTSIGMLANRFKVSECYAGNRGGNKTQAHTHALVTIHLTYTLYRMQTKTSILLIKCCK